jgi:hypothetical protein
MKLLMEKQEKIKGLVKKFYENAHLRFTRINEMIRNNVPPNAEASSEKLGRKISALVPRIEGHIKGLDKQSLEITFYRLGEVHY